MSLDLTFVAISSEDASMLVSDPTAVDETVRRKRRFLATLSLTGRWDALQAAVNNAGFRSSHFIDEVLSNGCEVVEEDLVFRQAQDLAKIDHTHLQALLSQSLSREQDRLHQFRAFGELVAFYASASAQGWAVIFYAQ